MGPDSPADRPFARSMVKSDGRLLILSTCMRCGKGKLVSSHDGTLLDWEIHHQCERRPRPRLFPWLRAS